MDAERCVTCGRWTVSHTITRRDLPPLCIACEGKERRAASEGAESQGGEK